MAQLICETGLSNQGSPSSLPTVTTVVLNRVEEKKGRMEGSDRGNNVPSDSGNGQTLCRDLQVLWLGDFELR